MITFTDVFFPLLMLGLAFCWWYQSYRNKNFYQNIPSPPAVPLLGNALDFTDTIVLLDTMLRYIKDYGGLVKVRIGPTKKFLLVADYKMLEFVLSSTKILTKSEDYNYLDSWLGTGLLTGSGAKWKKHRRLLTPAFHLQILEQFIDVFDSCGDILIKKLTKEMENDSVDVYPYVTLCSLDIICESTMGTRINAQDDINSEYVHSVKEICRIIIERSVSAVQMYNLLFMFTKNYAIQRKAVRILHEKANSVISKRIQEKRNQVEETSQGKQFDVKKKKAFLDLILEATVDGQPLTQEEIREEVDTFMFAGHDTTASAIAFALFCLANNPNVQNKAYKEQQEIFEGNIDPSVTYANLQSMKYLEQVIKETLRLYPSVPFIGRQSENNFQYGDTWIPKGDTMLLFVYGMHRDPNYFEDPEKFNPDRFENFDSSIPYAYIPFSAGPRNCIGQKFAMLEMKSIISKILRKFELQPTVPRHTLKLAAQTVLKSVNGIKIKLKLRN